MVEQVVPRLGPHIVLWGVSTLGLSENFGLAAGEGYRQALASRRDPLGRVDRWLARHSVLVAHRRVLRNPSAQFGLERIGSNEAWRRASSEITSSGDRVDPFRIDEDDLVALIRTLEELQAGGRRVVLVLLPGPIRFRALAPEGEATSASVREILRRVAADHGVVVVDPGTDWGEDDFVDFTHLDVEGASRLTGFVAAGSVFGNHR